MLIKDAIATENRDAISQSLILLLDMHLSMKTAVTANRNLTQNEDLSLEERL